MNSSSIQNAISFITSHANNESVEKEAGISHQNNEGNNPNNFVTILNNLVFAICILFVIISVLCVVRAIWGFCKRWEQQKRLRKTLAQRERDRQQESRDSFPSGVR